MKKLSLLIAIVFCCAMAEAQDQSATTYQRDTIWLKTGMTVPCQIIEDSTNNEYVYVNFVSDPDKTIKETRFSWKQIKTIHRQSEPYIPLFSTYRIELEDGTTLIGMLLSETDTEIELQLEGVGQLTVNRDNIKSMTQLGVSGYVKKSLWFKNPHATRHLFAPTAIPLMKGEGYYQNIYIIGNMFNYGILDNLSIGAGFDFVTMFASTGDGWNPMLNFNIKSGFQVSDKFHAGAGAMYLTMPGEFSAGIGYGIGTFGNYNSNMSLGLGWGFVDDTFEQKPFIMVGGMARLSEKLWFVSENWIAPVDDNNYYTVVSYGIRFAANRIAVDLAFINSKDIFDVILIGFPFVDFVIKLGKE